MFRKVTDIENSPEGGQMTDDEMRHAPIDSFKIDSLTTMEFIMAVEDGFSVELSEADVNRCDSIEDISELVRALIDV